MNETQKRGRYVAETEADRR